MFCTFVEMESLFLFSNYALQNYIFVPDGLVQCIREETVSYQHPHDVEGPDYECR